MTGWVRDALVYLGMVAVFVGSILFFALWVGF